MNEACPVEAGYINTALVKIKESMERFRKDMGDVSQLAESIKTKGQIQPIVLNRSNELACGGRRLAACIVLGIPVKYIYEDCMDPLKLREWELEENLQRKSFTPAEEVCAIAEIHRIRQIQFGVPIVGKEGGQTTAKTARELGVSRGSVEQAIQMAEMIEAFPALAAVKKKSDITKAAKGMNKLALAMNGQQKFEEQIAASNVPFTLIKADSIEHMVSLADRSINILCTDPLYGIEAEKICASVGGSTGGAFASTGYKIEDCPEKALLFYDFLAEQSIRFCTENAHGYVFCAPEHFWTIRQMFLKNGWRVHIKPIIWIKRENGQCNVPSAWPASCYEMLLYLRRDHSRLTKEAMPDWIECKPVNENLRLHVYEKPVSLIYNLLSRVSLPGQTVYDPFMGSGPTIEAASELKLFSTGVDISLEAYASATRRMAVYTEKRINRAS